MKLTNQERVQCEDLILLGSRLVVEAIHAGDEYQARHWGILLAHAGNTLLDDVNAVRNTLASVASAATL